MSNYQFDIPAHHKSIIKVIGIGGGGSNAVNHMYNQGIKGVEFIVCNTDVQALQSSPIPNKLQIGTNLTEGLGAGANPEVGRNAALESKEEIRDLLSDNTKMVFITAGMGGGTGTGAAPVIARIAKDLDILTVGIVTHPFKFEGLKKSSIAEEGILELKENCDTVLVILNDKLREIYGNLPVTKAFAEADNILTTAAKGIAEIITVSGYVNVDFEDVKTVMKDSGAAVMGSATISGEERALKAAQQAIASPLLNNTDIHGAKKILLSITSGEHAELQMDELTDITNYIQEEAGDEAEVIFGHGVDPDLQESINVTVIATGFKAGNYGTKLREKKKVIDLESSKQIRLFDEELLHEKRQEEVVPDTEITPEKEKQGYQFEKPEKEVKTEERKPEKVMFRLDGNRVAPEESTEEISGIDQEKLILEEKRNQLLKQARERSEKLSKVKNYSISDDEYKERWDVPAYLRKKVKLEEVPHSSEHEVSRYNLNDENQILGNNKFLHDNVD
ncbi:MAG: cell division protein FtsZ [Cyclobacteriaceae bacterium]|nr:cell division protein FtsZ [Cyclobacteriaceae bacterium]